MGTEPSARLKARIKELETVVRRAAKLNCAKPPMGKHYKDQIYCGECTSCLARAVLKS